MASIRPALNLSLALTETATYILNYSKLFIQMRFAFGKIMPFDWEKYQYYLKLGCRLYIDMYTNETNINIRAIILHWQYLKA